MRVTLREEHKPRVCEGRVLRRIFGLKTDEVTEGWRRLPDDELHNLYSSPNIIRINKSRRMRWTGHMTRKGEKGNACKYFWGGGSRRKETTTKT
jgi:hypothetical protein